MLLLYCNNVIKWYIMLDNWIGFLLLLVYLNLFIDRLLYINCVDDIFEFKINFLYCLKWVLVWW